jgi:2TM domain-containing protein
MGREVRRPGTEEVDMAPTKQRAMTSDGSRPAVGEDDLAREQAIKQIKRRRDFRVRLAASGMAMVVLVAIWAISEYHNAGGWPTQGFSQSSGLHDVWNFWIIYPLLGWALIVATAGWIAHGRKPISEREIQEELEREVGHR